MQAIELKEFKKSRDSIIRFRKKSYSHFQYNLLEFSDPLDLIAKHYSVESNGSVILLCRIIIAPKNFELSFLKIINESTRNGIEISRFCTCPDISPLTRNKAMITLFKFINQLCLTNQYSYILACCNKKQLPLYLKMGFVKTGEKFTPKLFDEINYPIILTRENQNITRIIKSHLTSQGSGRR